MKFRVTYLDHNSKAKITEMFFDIESDSSKEASDKADQLMRDNKQNPDKWTDVDIEYMDDNPSEFLRKYLKDKGIEDFPYTF